jgi:geranylgeranyl diphosphate synthase type II
MRRESGLAAAGIARAMETRAALVDAALDRFLPPTSAVPQRLHEAMRYSVFAGGKRFRPFLLLASAEACGLAPEQAMPAACAVEMIHTYSLIHDDLPSMDDSDTRRGLPTCHVVFGEAMAVLAGDALHALAFEILAGMAETYGHASRIAAVTRELSHAIGTPGMVGGQVMDLLAEHGELAHDAVPEIHRRKTGALVRACARAGPQLAGDADSLDPITRYGEHLGLAFQITDDVLDVIGETAKLGKHTGGDEAAAKATYPSVFGLPAAKRMAREEMDRAIEALKPLGADRGDVLAALAKFVVQREF